MKNLRRTAFSASLLAIALVAFAGAGCGTLERAAAKDPQRCERDPNCDRRRDKSFDCSTQCSYDPECERRCREVEMQNGTIGR